MVGRITTLCGGAWGWFARRGGGLVTLGALSLLLAAVLVPSAPARADRFEDWVRGLRADARTEGVKQQTLDAALAGVVPIPRVLELDRKQPEFALTFQEYLDRVVPQSRVAKARERLRQRTSMLEEVAAQAGVPARFIVAPCAGESD